MLETNFIRHCKETLDQRAALNRLNTRLESVTFDAKSWYELIARNPLQSFNMGIFNTTSDGASYAYQAHYIAPELVQVDQADFWDYDDLTFPSECKMQSLLGMSLVSPAMRFVTPPVVAHLPVLPDEGKPNVSWFNNRYELDTHGAFKLMSNVYNTSRATITDPQGLDQPMRSNTLCTAKYIARYETTAISTPFIKSYITDFFCDKPNNDLLPEYDTFTSYVQEVASTLNLTEFLGEFSQIVSDLNAEMIDCMVYDEDYDDDDDDGHFNAYDYWSRGGYWKTCFTVIYLLQAAYFNKYFPELYTIAAALNNPISDEQRQELVACSIPFWNTFLNGMPLDTDIDITADTPTNIDATEHDTLDLSKLSSEEKDLVISNKIKVIEDLLKSLDEANLSLAAFRAIQNPIQPVAQAPVETHDIVDTPQPVAQMPVETHDIVDAPQPVAQMPAFMRPDEDTPQPVALVPVETHDIVDTPRPAAIDNSNPLPPIFGLPTGVAIDNSSPLPTVFNAFDLPTSDVSNSNPVVIRLSTKLLCNVLKTFGGDPSTDQLIAAINDGTFEQGFRDFEGSTVTQVSNDLDAYLEELSNRYHLNFTTLVHTDLSLIEPDDYFGEADTRMHIDALHHLQILSSENL